MPFLKRLRLFPFSIAFVFNSIIGLCMSGRPIVIDDDDFFARNNTRIIIDKVYNLGGRTIRLGANDTLVFKGGVILNGVIIGDDTFIEAPDMPIFQMVTLTGSWDKNIIASPEWFGAKGDGVTDDAEPIQLALDYFRVVRLGGKKYATSKTIQVHSNTEFSGMGNHSVLYNIVNSGYNKTIVNIGILSSGKVLGSPIVRDRMEIHSLEGKKVTLKSRDRGLQPGHALLLTNGEDNGHAFIHQDFAVATAVSDKVVILDSAFTNKRLLGSDKLYLVDLTLSQDAHGNNIGQIVHDVYVHDMMLSHKYPYTGSGMYALGVAGYNVHVARVNMNTVTTPFGSNMFVKSIVEDCDCVFSGGISDFAELQIGSTYKKLVFTRNGANMNHCNEGFAMNNGYNLKVQDIHIDNGDKKGAFRSVNIYGIQFVNCSYKNTVTNVTTNDYPVFLVNASAGEETEIINCINESELSFLNAGKAVNPISKSTTMPMIKGFAATLVNPTNYSPVYSLYYNDYKNKTDAIIKGNVRYSSHVQNVSKKGNCFFSYDMYLIYRLDGDQGFKIETNKQASISIMIDGREIASFDGSGKIVALLDVSRYKDGMMVKTTWQNGIKESQSSYTYKGYDWNDSHRVTLSSKTTGNTKVTDVMGYMAK